MYFYVMQFLETLLQPYLIIYPSSTNDNLSWKHHVTDIAIKLNRAIVLLFNIRNFVNVNTLKTLKVIYLMNYCHQFPTTFSFTLFSDIHNYNTAASSTGKLFKPSF